MLIAIGTAQPSVGIDFGAIAAEGAPPGFPKIDVPRVFIREVTRTHRLKSGEVLYRVPAGNPGSEAQAHSDPHFRFEIALGEPEVFQGQALVPTLHQLSEMTGGVLDGFRGALS